MDNELSIQPIQRFDHYLMLIQVSKLTENLQIKIVVKINHYFSL